MATVLLFVTYLSALTVWGTITASTLAIGFAMHALWRNALLRAPDSIVAVRFGRSGLEYQFRNGQWHGGQEVHAKQPAVFLHSSFVSRWLSVVTLRFSDSYWHRHIVLMPDSQSAEAGRRLRIWLKWSRSEVLNVPSV